MDVNMKVKHGNVIVDAWKISKQYDEDWVVEGFETRKIYWQKNKWYFVYFAILCKIMPNYLQKREGVCYNDFGN